MSSSDDTQTYGGESPDEPKRRQGDHRPSSFGLRAAVLAGLVVAGAAGGVAVAEGLQDDPVRVISDSHSTCCIPAP